jgi:altronate dehydratase large subunit
MSSLQEMDEERPEDSTFEVFEPNASGVGLRRRLLVVPTVICSHIVADHIAAGVEGAVSIPHDHGCAQIGADHEQTERTLLNLSKNPNVSAVVVVGLGCEHLQSRPFAERVEAQGVPVRELSIQGVGGTDACETQGVELARSLVHHNRPEKVTGSLDDLTVGVISSDLNASTVQTGAPLVGRVVDRISASGGRVIVAGTERLVPHRSVVTDRVTDSAGEGWLQDRLDELSMYPGKSQSISTRAAGLSPDAVIGHWGSGPIQSVLEHGVPPEDPDGVHLMDSSSRFEEAATGLAAAGATVILHLTDEGITTGHPVVPVLKISASAKSLEAVGTDIDIDARKETPPGVLRRLIKIADGEPTAAETHGMTSFALSRVGPSM